MTGSQVIKMVFMVLLYLHLKSGSSSVGRASASQAENTFLHFAYIQLNTRICFLKIRILGLFRSFGHHRFASYALL